MNAIFIEGWLGNAILYGVIYFLAEYATYKIIFKTLVTAPKSYDYRELKYWNRKVLFIGAVIFAPLYEEVMFTYLAYASFLNYTQPGQEALIIIFVASFFALLHLPGDLRVQQRSYSGINIYNLLIFQFQRFFYSLTAYFIFIQTGVLWITILIHFFYNAFVSIYQFEMEDQLFPMPKTDVYLGFIFVVNICFGLISCYFFYLFYPTYLAYLVIAMALMLPNYFREMAKL